MTGWVALLDAMDEGLTSSPPVLLESLPTDLGPLSAELTPRATATLQRMAEVEATLEQDRVDVARELTALSAAKASAVSATAAVPHFLDTRA